MRGMYKDPESRDAIRHEWADLIIPKLAREEAEPFRPFIGDQKDLVCLDIGANKGFWSACLLRTFPGQVKCIYAFDPSPENYKELMNTYDNLIFSQEEQRVVLAFNTAMGEEIGEATLYTNEEGSPLASLYRHGTGSYPVDGLTDVRLDIEVRTIVDTVDAFICRHAIARVDIMKIDTEGHELSVLKGAAESLKTGIIRRVLFEFGMHQVESRTFFKDFWLLFTSLGYKMYRCENSIAVPIHKYSYKYENFSWIWEILAIASEDSEDRLRAGC